jgi:multidrug efflux pump subunit AcrB
VSSLNEIGNIPVSTALAANGPPIPGFLSNVATLKRDSVPTNLNQTNIQPVYDIYASAQGRDLGSISGDIGKVVAELQKELKPGNTIQVLGPVSLVIRSCKSHQAMAVASRSSAGIFSKASAMSLDVYIENLRVCLAPEDAAGTISG